MEIKHVTKGAFSSLDTNKINLNIKKNNTTIMNESRNKTNKYSYITIDRIRQRYLQPINSKINNSMI